MADLALFRSRRSRFALLVGATVTAVACSDAFKSGQRENPGPDDAGVTTQPDSSVHVIGPQPGFDAGHGGDDAGDDAAPPIDSAVPCTEGTRSCSAGQVVTCLDGGAWGNPVACGADSPVCSGGMCTSPSLDGGAAIPPSCAPGGLGMSNCGWDGGVESCCTSLEVPTGTFDRTYNSDPDSGVAMDAGDPAKVSGFRLDKYEVTVGRFRQFVKAVLPSSGAGWMPTAGSGKHTHVNGGNGLADVSPDAGASFEPGWDSANDISVTPTTPKLTSGCDQPAYSTWTDSPQGNESLPVACVNGFESYAFCIWDGGFLPSEAEWQYAASGGEQEREYAWGAIAPGTDSSYAIYGCNYPTPGANCSILGSSSVAGVGTARRGAGRWGQLDLMGNVNEANVDSYSSGQTTAYVVPCNDCVELATSTVNYGRSIRGGNFNQDKSTFSTREGLPQTFRGAGAGFRCARTP